MIGDSNYMYRKYIYILRNVMPDMVKYLQHIQNMPDNLIADNLHQKFGYLFPQFTFFDWVQLLSEYRSIEKEQGS